MKRIIIILLSLLMLCTIARAAELDYQSDFSVSIFRDIKVKLVSFMTSV